MMILSAPLRTSQSCNVGRKNKEECGQYLSVERHGALPVNLFPRSPDQFTLFAGRSGFPIRRAGSSGAG